MALSTNSISGFPFIALEGEVVPPSYQVVANDRPGVDGTEFILVGNKGRPFSLVSKVDCASYVEGRSVIFPAYLATKVLQPVPLTQGGIVSTSDGWLVKVLDVIMLRCATIRGAVGNKQGNSPNQGYLECRWDLVAVPT